MVIDRVLAPPRPIFLPKQEGALGIRAKQFIGAIALTATVGSGAALADSSVVTTSVSSSSGEEVTSNSIESSSISSSSNNTTVQKATAETSKVESTSSHSVSTELSSSDDKSSKSISTNRSSVSADISQSAKVDIKDSQANSAQNVVPYNQDQASRYTWTSYPDYTLQAQVNYQGVSPFIQSPGEPVSNPSPAKSDPLGGIIDELNFLSETIVPLPFVLTYGGALPVFAFATSALLFSLLVLILIGSRRHISSIYTDLLRYSGFVHAPRSDASRAHYFATPLKWVLSSAPA